MLYEVAAKYICRYFFKRFYKNGLLSPIHRKVVQKMEERSRSPYIYYFFILQKKCHVLKIGSLSASAGKYLTKCIFLHIFRKYFFAIPCWVKCPYLVKCCPKLPPFRISATTTFHAFHPSTLSYFLPTIPKSHAAHTSLPLQTLYPPCFQGNILEMQKHQKSYFPNFSQASL